MPLTEKPYNNGTWTEARFNSFIKGALRALTKRWGPRYTSLKEARIERGVYKCAGYKKRSHKAPKSIKIGEKRVNNIFVDHIDPIIGPEGFTSWDEVIRKMFCEKDGLQILCKDCHDRKTQDERTQHAVARRSK